MPIIKTEILGSKVEINYEEKEHKKLLDLISNFKDRLKEFPNNGRISNNSIIFLAALKAEDELLETKNLYDESKKKYKTIEDQKNTIENLKKEIILLKDNIKSLETKNLTEGNDYSKAFESISKLEEEIELIKNKIKETINE
tara:strand:+ start:1742 stop:2167 length:426 start_codon:yes stop_codon:yes gene_type:complete